MYHYVCDGCGGEFENGPGKHRNQRSGTECDGGIYLAQHLPASMLREIVAGAGQDEREPDADVLAAEREPRVAELMEERYGRR